MRAKSRFSAWGAICSAAVVVASIAVVAPEVARAAPAALSVVTDGEARFQILTPTLIRLEYAGDRRFEDVATLTAINRAFPATPYTTAVTNGVREIRTEAVTLRYRVSSGPFTRANVSVTLNATGVAGTPEFPSYCQFSTACEAENALLLGHASRAADHTGNTGSGFVAGYEKAGTGIEVAVSGIATAGSYQLAVRYANAAGSDGQNVARTLTAKVNGGPNQQLTLPPSGSWDTWTTAAITVSLRAGTNQVQLLQNAGDSGRVNVDSVAVTPTSTTTYPAAATGLLTTAYGAGPTNVLGGWKRSLDNPAQVPVPLNPGVLNRDGWYLLDDTRTALFGADHKVSTRPSHGSLPYQDGYLFGYGRDYKRALGDLNALSGGMNLLPQSAYGVWYSRYHAYSQADYTNTLLPRFRSSFVPVDWLVVDTDFKSPNGWNGWNWNTSLFPNPDAFMAWTKSQGLSVSLNVHPTISELDPKFAQANAEAGGLEVDTSAWTQVRPRLFDWSKPQQLSAYLKLHDSFDQQGVRAWWLDYCSFCGASTASNPQVAPDNWINQSYADRAEARGVRGFSFARVGGAEYGGIHSAYPVGPWSERRNTLQFTGDTPGSWEMLAFAPRFTAAEAAAGLSNVSHDIGSFHGDHLADDLYVRWVQLGTFQPIDRLHSDHADRLPWEYGAEANAAATRFLRLREALVPYTYTLARQANTTGVPIVRPMYLNYPTTEAAFAATGQYQYGDNLLVAPITSPNSAGSGSATVWVPPGSWTDYFTGTTYTGPANVTISAPLSRMPVLLKAGGIVPTRTDYVDNQVERAMSRLTLNVAAGADGTFALYQDAGEGHGYRNGQSTSTPFTWANGGRTLTIGATTGSYAGAVIAREYTLRLSNSTAPTAVRVDGALIPETDWSFNANTRTVTVTTRSLPVNVAHTVSLEGNASGNPTSGVAVGLAGSCLDVRGGAANDGQPVQLYTCNHSAAQQVSYASDGGVRVLGKCLTPASTANRGLVAIQACNGTANQSWSRHPDGSVRHSSGRCLDVPDGNSVPGAVQLQLYDCNKSAAQQWRLPPGPVTAAGNCVDVMDGDAMSATAIQLYTCNATDAQRLHTPGDGTIRVLGKCLDVARAGTANGTRVQLFDCNGTPAQTWVSGADGALVNTPSGRCLDSVEGRVGDPLRIQDCNNGAAQRFRLG